MGALQIGSWVGHFVIPPHLPHQQPLHMHMLEAAVHRLKTAVGRMQNRLAGFLLKAL